MNIIKPFRALTLMGVSTLAIAGAVACGPIDVDAPIDADTDVDNTRTTQVDQIREVHIIELETEQKEAVCTTVEETSVSCTDKHGETFEYQYTRSSCEGDLDAVPSDCGATVDDFLACEAIDACSRRTNPACEKLLQCEEELDIFIDIDIEVDVDTSTTS